MIDYANNLPELIHNWIEEGKEIVEPNMVESWKDMVYNRAIGLYKGFEIECAISIIKSLNSGDRFEYANSILESQNHSGASYALTCNIVAKFSKRGTEFVKWIKASKKVVDPNNILESDLLRSLEEANKILLFTYNKLNNLTTDDYAKGGDKEIRDMIKEYLRLND